MDTTAKKVETGVYNLEVNKLEPVYRTIKAPASPLAGQTVLVLKGSFTIVDDDTYSGRKLWQDFWVCFDGAKKDLKRLMSATGVQQTDGMTLTEWAAQFVTLNPTAKFQAPVVKEADKRDPTGEPVNRINFIHARATA